MSVQTVTPTAIMMAPLGVPVDTLPRHLDGSVNTDLDLRLRTRLWGNNVVRFKTRTMRAKATKMREMLSRKNMSMTAMRWAIL